MFRHFLNELRKSAIACSPLFIALLLVACEQHNSEDYEMVPRNRPQTVQLETGSVEYIATEYVFDGCTYVRFTPKDKHDAPNSYWSEDWGTHKGTCPNPKHIYRDNPLQ